MKIKVFESEEIDRFEEEVNNFTSNENIEVINMQYSNVGLAPDTEYGWHTALVHCVMIQYKEKTR